MIHFAAVVLGQPLDPWQQWLVIHAGEMLPDGRPRFRQVLVIVARQNGKTHLCKILALFWLFVERWPMVFGTSTDLEQAKEAWEAAVESAEAAPALAGMLNARHKRVGNGQQDFWTTDRCHYKIGAANRKGGRGKSIDRAIGDELREQHTWDAYDAAYNAMNARPRAQVVYITNMGDSRSVVLNALRTDALRTVHGDEPLERPVAIFEWSAPAGTHPMDPAGHAAANPQYGRRMDPDVIMASARRVSKPGADPQELAGFLTEMLCVAVDHLDPAVDPARWAAAELPADLAGRAGGLAACVDVAPDLQHATLAVAASMPDGRVRVELVKAWDGASAVAALRAELPDLLARIRPHALGWFPGGPAAALDADLRDRRAAGRRGWPPRGTTVAEIRGDTPSVVMGFAALVGADGVWHSGQPLLNAHVEQAEKAWVKDRWTFTRRGAGHCDGAYAAAGAVHLARTMPVRRRATRPRTTDG